MVACKICAKHKEKKGLGGYDLSSGDHEHLLNFLTILPAVVTFFSSGGLTT